MWTFERGGRKGGVECETKFTKDSTFFKKAYKSSTFYLRYLVYVLGVASLCSVFFRKSKKEKRKIFNATV